MPNDWCHLWYVESGGELWILAGAYETELDALEAARDLAEVTGKRVRVRRAKQGKKGVKLKPPAG